MAEGVTLSVIGLPGSGKTTFLAALWHVLAAEEVPTRLRLHTLGRGNYAHLNAIATRWREAREQERTKVGVDKVVEIDLETESGSSLRVAFPDVSGERFSQIWEERICEKEIVDSLAASSGILLFINADDIQFPRWIADESAITDIGPLPLAPVDALAWTPKISPTQVKLVDILQAFADFLPISTRRVCVILSAWDKCEEIKLTPDEFLATRLPLLWQYLTQRAHRWEWTVFGVSAQGGDFLKEKDNSPTRDESAERLCSMNDLTRRVQVVHAETSTHDLTEPLLWLSR